MISLLLLGCASKPTVAPEPVVEPLPTAGHTLAARAAQERVPDAARGGAPIQQGAAPLPPFLGGDRGSATYVGAAGCSSCHEKEFAAFMGSDHARSREVLEGTGRQNDPSCLKCHTTGFGHPSGYGAGGDPARLNHTGCEACHGPGSDHLTAPASGYGVLPSGFPACVACHTHDNSPDFGWGAYWAQIAH